MSSTCGPSPKDIHADITTIGRPKPDILSEASDYRKHKSVLLYTYRDSSVDDEPKPIFVFCPYAGKPARPRASNNYNKDVSSSIMGATVIWLVCPYINAMIGRMEGLGLVKRMNTVLQTDRELAAAHIGSHSVFEEYVSDYLMKDSCESRMYRRNFIDVAGNKRKYGNAGVSHVLDMKCYHALVAQSLGGADNPIGSSLVLYFFHLFHILEGIRSSVTSVTGISDDEREIRVKYTSKAHECDKSVAGDECNNYSINNSEEFVKIVDNQDNYFAFLTTLGPNPVSNDKWKIDLRCPSIKAKCEKLPLMCREMIMALEGKSLSLRKKRRIN